MGGKGQRRREKNYKAAHGGGGNARLPPPPNPSSLDALPSKLRKIMSLAGSEKQSFNGAKRHTGNGVEKGIHSEEGTDSMSKGMKRRRNDDNLTAQNGGHDDEAPQSSMRDNKKKKKKSNKPNDRRFDKMVEPAAGSQRKERKKQRLEERKKKNKRPKSDDDEDFPGHEKIKFGDVVEAPPKLITVPKAFKAKVDASQERLRLQAVDAYRKRKGWSSRPGVQLLPPVITSPLL